MRPVAVAVAILMTTVAFVSGAPISSEVDAESETCLRIGFLGKVDSLNPNVGLEPSSEIFYSLIYDCLQGVGEDLEAVPNLALEWRIAEDFEPYGSVWDYNLTENAYWHDGVPLTAEDVAYTMNIMSDYLVQMWKYQPYSHYMDYAEVIGDHAVRMHFYDMVTTEPMPAAYARMLCIPIFPKHIVEKMTIDNFGFNWIGATEGHDPPLVGSGPFMVTENIIEEFSYGDKITLIRNPNHHWKADTGLEIQFDKLELRFFAEEAELVEALEEGMIDVAQLPREDYLTMKERVESGQLENIAMFDGPSPNQQCTYIMLNTGPLGPNPSIADPAIRQALATATDKQYVVENHYLGLANEANTLIPSINEFWHYELTEEELYEYDLDLAAQILDDAGYRYVSSSTVREATADSYAVLASLVPEGTKLQYHLSINAKYPEERQIVMYLQEKWGDIGVVIDFDVVSEDAISLCPYDLGMWFWRGQADVDPHAILFSESMRSWGGWNENAYSEPDYEENFSLSIQSLDVDQRREYVHNCQRIQYEDVSYIMLGELFQTYAWRTDTFAGWGNWENHSGRSIDAAWSGNILYFELEPKDDDKTVAWALGAVTIGAVAAIAVVIVYLRRWR